MACCVVAAYVIMRVMSIADTFKTTSRTLEKSVFGAVAPCDTIVGEEKKKQVSTCRLNITGITCTACVDSIERALRKIPGVKSAVVSNILSQAIVTYNPKSLMIGDIMSRVEGIGYGVEEVFSESQSPSVAFQAADARRARSIRSWRVAVIGATMFTVPVVLLAVLPVATEGIEGLLCGVVVLCFGGQIHLEAASALRRRRTDMLLLSSLGLILAYAKSVFDCIANRYFLNLSVTGRTSFDSTAVLACVIVGGRFLKAKVGRDSTSSLNTLSTLITGSASLLVGDLDNIKVTTVPAESISRGDIIVTYPGDVIPVDGIVVRGSGNVSETYLTGEILPQFKSKGVEVRAGSVNQDTQLIFQATGSGNPSWLERTLQLMTDGDSRKSSIQESADLVASWFVAAVLCFTLFIGVRAYFHLGHPVSKAFDSMITVLLAACPCALGLGTPTAVMIGIAVASRANILLMGGSRAIEAASGIKTIIFDKTGTLTSGTFEVQDVSISPSWRASKAIWWSLVVAAEEGSKHPVAQGITAYAHKYLTALSSEETRETIQLLPSSTGVAGLGVSCDVLLLHPESRRFHISVGSRRFIESTGVIIPTDDEWTKSSTLKQSSSLVESFVAIDGTFSGSIWSRDEIRGEAHSAISLLRRRGYNVGIMTGSLPSAAHAVARTVGVDREWVWAALMPKDKHRCINEIKVLYGSVAMVGDNLNDVQAMASSDFSIAAFVDPSSITAIAADALLAEGPDNNYPPGLLKVPYIFELSNEVFRRIRQNLLWAMAYNVLAILLGSGLVSGLALTPIYAGLGMSLSSIVVLVNTMKLERWVPKNTDLSDGDQD